MKEIVIPVLVSEVYRKLETLMNTIENNPKGEKKVYAIIKDGVLTFEVFQKI